MTMPEMRCRKDECFSGCDISPVTYLMMGLMMIRIV